MAPSVLRKALSFEAVRLALRSAVLRVLVKRACRSDQDLDQGPKLAAPRRRVSQGFRTGQGSTAFGRAELRAADGGAVGGGAEEGG